MISFTIRQPIRFGGQPGALTLVHTREADEEPYIQLEDLGEAKADELALSGRKSKPTQMIPGFKWPGQDAHLASPEQARDLQLIRLILTALSLNNHPAFLPHGKDAAPEQERVKINFVDGKGKPEVKRSKSGETVIVNISNVQHNTQNNGQAGSLLNTLANVTPWGMAKVLGGTGVAVLGTYYLGPTVLNYAKNKLVGMVLPENLMARATEIVRTPLSWFGNGTVSTAATVTAARVAETATETLAATSMKTATSVVAPTITQAATETLANNGTTKVLPTVLQGDVPLSAVTGSVMDSISDSLGNAASVLGNVATRGLNLGLSFLNSPASMFVFPFFYSNVRRWRSPGSTPNTPAPPTPVYVYPGTGRKTGKIQGKIHGFL